MKKLTPYVAAILLIYCSSNEKISVTSDINKKFKIEDLKEDYTVLQSALEEAHPGIYRYITKEKFDALFDSLNSEIRSERTEIEFFRFISPIIAQIRCGHTSISLSHNYRNYMTKQNKYFPLQLKFISNKAYVLKSFSSNEIIPSGSEIISINQKTISEIIEMIFKMISSDGNIQTAKYRRLDEEFSELYCQCISPTDSFEIKYIPFGNNIVKDEVIPAKPWEEIKKYKSSYMARQKEPLKFEIMDNPVVAVMTIVTFIPRIIKNNYGDFYGFIDSTFTLLKEKNIKNLIIDVRGNNGGDVHYFSTVLSKFIDKPYRIAERIDVPTPKYSFLKYTQHGFFFNFVNSLSYVKNEKTGRFDLKGKSGWHQLINPQEPHFQGKIYMLIDGWSFSAASDFCAIAHSNAHDKITFIGEETGGAYYGNNSGDWIKLTLPNTQIQVNIPMRYYLLAVFDYPYYDRGVIPDLEVIPDIEDILNNKDTQLEFALNIIKQRNK